MIVLLLIILRKVINLEALGSQFGPTFCPLQLLDRESELNLNQALRCKEQIFQFCIECGHSVPLSSPQFSEFLLVP